MKLYVAVDTNVLVSALLSKKSDTATVLVIRSMLNGEFIPLYSEDILEEYDDAFLVTGNLKHYPGRSYIVTPVEFMHILEENKKQAGIEE